MNRRHALLALALTLGTATAAHAVDANTVYLQTKDGRITIELRPDLAPKHVKQIKTLVSQGFYNGIKFHRVIDGFMAQTGDPKGNGTGGSSLPNIPAEFTQSAQFRRGTVGMARSQDPNSANSQFFICFDDARFLDKQYTVWGKVVEGMDVVDTLNKGEPPRSPDKIVTATVAAA